MAPCRTPSSVPSLRFVDVGQGAALIVDGGGDDVVIVDSGPPSGGEALLAALDEAGIRRVGLWIHTHFDADHVGGVARVLAGLDGTEGTSDDVHAVLAWDRGSDALPATEVVDQYFASRLGETRHVPLSGELWQSGFVGVRVLRPDADVPLAGENTRGLAACVEVGTLRVLVLGDLPSAHAETVSASCPDVDLLWVGHHGSADAISAELVEITSPDAAIVSAGDNNPYCHPAPVTTALLADVPTYYTGIAATDPAAPCGDLALRWPIGHHWLATDLCVEPG